MRVITKKTRDVLVNRKLKIKYENKISEKFNTKVASSILLIMNDKQNVTQQLTDAREQN